ncbi:hypothetical protein SAMN06296008_107123 [Polynucleobacter kasalickyi]|uniref:Uncharacterized protein n=1 Tax=Polynucleobacter kasalickyi TaxID=1938817 RepID=A0A1W2A5E5_9BURK|nr:hypothetical protein SAMN06296008_107123 [Polynucleobacter kasalickyi]
MTEDLDRDFFYSFQEIAFKMGIFNKEIPEVFSLSDKFSKLDRMIRLDELLN